MSEMLVNEIIVELSQELENQLDARDKLTIKIEALKTTIQTLTNYIDFEDIDIFIGDYFVED